MKRTFVIGDIHGNYKALKQCLERSNFNKEEDTLITLGDIVDGWNEVYECVEELLTIKNRIDLRGNHDDWFNEYLTFGVHPDNWQQGGLATKTSYLKNLNLQYLNPADIPQSHIDFFKNQINYYIDDKNKCFVHGGFYRKMNISEQKDLDLLYWDRELWDQAKSCKDGQRLKTADNFSEIFIGHTHVDNWRNPDCLPQESGGVWNLDTGAGFSGKLTIMNVDTHEYFQSDLGKDLYPIELNARQ